MPAASDSSIAIMMLRRRGGPIGVFGNRLGVEMVTSFVCAPWPTLSSRCRCNNVFKYCLLVSRSCVIASKSI